MPDCVHSFTDQDLRDAGFPVCEWSKIVGCITKVVDGDDRRVADAKAFAAGIAGFCGPNTACGGSAGQFARQQARLAAWSDRPQAQVGLPADSIAWIAEQAFQPA